MNVPTERSRICSDLRCQHQCTEWRYSRERWELDQDSDRRGRTVATQELNPTETRCPDQQPVLCNAKLQIYETLSLCRIAYEHSWSLTQSICPERMFTLRRLLKLKGFSGHSLVPVYRTHDRQDSNDILPLFFFYTDCLPRHVIDNFYSPNDNYVIFTHTDKKALQCRIFLRSASSERRMSLETDCVIDCQGHPRSLKAHTQLPISDQHQL